MGDDFTNVMRGDITKSIVGKRKQCNTSRIFEEFEL